MAKREWVRWNLIGLAICFGALGCAKENKAYVECEGVGTGYNCTITHQQGDDPLKVCWSVAVKCQNGTKAVGKACQQVQASAKTTTLIPVTDMKNAEKCDLATQVAVEGLKLTVL